MKEKEKFKLVNEEELFLVDSDENVTNDVENDNLKEETQENKKRITKKYVIGSIVMLLVTVGITLFGLSWQDDYSLKALGDALWLTFALELLIGWTLFMYNLNILSPILYAVQTLGRMIVGKPRKTDYYTYMLNVKDNQIPRFIYVLFLISTLIVLIPAVIIMFIYI